MNRTALLSTALTALALAGSAHAADLAVTVHDVRAQTGTLRVALVDSAAAWDGKAKPVQAQQAAPSGDSAHFTFKGVPAGSYAVLLTHDENDKASSTPTWSACRWKATASATTRR